MRAISERDDLLLGLRQLIELDHGFGVEFARRGSASDFRGGASTAHHHGTGASGRHRVDRVQRSGSSSSTARHRASGGAAGRSPNRAVDRRACARARRTTRRRAGCGVEHGRSVHRKLRRLQTMLRPDSC